MTLLQNGNVGIGTANPSAKLNIQQGPGTFVRLGAPGYGSIDLGVDNNGSFLIDNSTVARLLTLYTNGNMVITGSLSQNSDARLKTNVTSIAPSTLDQLTSLNPATFGWLNAAQGTGTQVGFIAQDVQKLFPLLVATSSATSTLTPDGTFTLNYIGFIPTLSRVSKNSRRMPATPLIL